MRLGSGRRSKNWERAVRLRQRQKVLTLTFFYLFLEILLVAWSSFLKSKELVCASNRRVIGGDYNKWVLFQCFLLPKFGIFDWWKFKTSLNTNVFVNFESVFPYKPIFLHLLTCFIKSWVFNARRDDKAEEKTGL